MDIGNWVRRRHGATGMVGKWHVVESVIGGDAITRCGRRMKPQSSEGRLEVSSVEPLTRMIGQPQNCQRCG